MCDDEKLKMELEGEVVYLDVYIEFLFLRGGRY